MSPFYRGPECGGECLGWHTSMGEGLNQLPLSRACPFQGVTVGLPVTGEIAASVQLPEALGTG